MSTIKKINIYLNNRILDGTASNTRMTWFRKQAIFVEIISSNGLTGWGECWTFDESANALVEFLKSEIAPKVLGQATKDIENIWNNIWQSTVLSGRHGMTAAALSGIDIALWDIAGKSANKTVASLISNNQTPIPVYASGGLYKKNQTPADIATELTGHVSDGHNMVKMKIGALSFEKDLERLTAVREAIGSETKLIVDAVYSLDRKSAKKWLPHWKKSSIIAVQAPFPADDWESMVWLNQEENIPVMAFEAESRIEIFRMLLERQALGIMQFSCVAVGGITATLKFIELAKKFNIPVSLQCSSTFFAEAVALQVAASCLGVSHVELHQFHTSFYDIAPTHSVTPINGCVQLPKENGIGFTPPKDHLEMLASIE